KFCQFTQQAVLFWHMNLQAPVGRLASRPYEGPPAMPPLFVLVDVDILGVDHIVTAWRTRCLRTGGRLAGLASGPAGRARACTTTRLLLVESLSNAMRRVSQLVELRIDLSRVTGLDGLLGLGHRGLNLADRGHRNLLAIVCDSLLSLIDQRIKPVFSF